MILQNAGGHGVGHGADEGSESTAGDADEAPGRHDLADFPGDAVGGTELLTGVLAHNAFGGHGQRDDVGIQIKGDAAFAESRQPLPGTEAVRGLYLAKQAFRAFRSVPTCFAAPLRMTGCGAENHG